MAAVNLFAVGSAKDAASCLRFIQRVRVPMMNTDDFEEPGLLGPSARETVLREAAADRACV